MDARRSAAAGGGILSGMVLKLAADLPMLWRTPSSVQFGSRHPVAVVEGIGDGETRLLGALAAGVSPSGFAMLARAAHVAPEDADRLLRDVAPALERPAAAPTRVAVMGDSTLARAIAGLLGDALTDPDEATVVVLVADWVVSPADHVRWLNRDVAHLPVVVTERGVEVGPFVEPGASPCLYCVHLARTDLDPAWPAVATQLWGRAPREPERTEVAEAAAFVARRVVAHAAGEWEPGAAWEFDGSGGVSARRWERHPGCRCAAPGGSDWADAPSAVRAVPSSGSAVAVPV